MSLPDDVAQYLDKHPNSSAIVTEAVRARMNRSATTKAMLEAAGFTITDEGVAKWRGKFAAPTNEQRERDRRFLEAAATGDLPEDGR